jgi:hypothetical protein
VQVELHLAQTVQIQFLAQLHQQVAAEVVMETVRLK